MLSYYLNKGYSMEEAQAMASPRQSSSKGKKWFVRAAHTSQPVTAHGMRRANVNSSTRVDKHALDNLYRTLNRAVKAGDKELQALCNMRLAKLAFV